MSHALRVTSGKSTGGPACRGGVRRRVAESVSDRCLCGSVGCFATPEGGLAPVNQFARYRDFPDASNKTGASLPPMTRSGHPQLLAVLVGVIDWPPFEWWPHANAVVTEPAVGHHRIRIS